MRNSTVIKGSFSATRQPGPPDPPVFIGFTQTGEQSGRLRFQLPPGDRAGTGLSRLSVYTASNSLDGATVADLENGVAGEAFILPLIPDAPGSNPRAVDVDVTFPVPDGANFFAAYVSDQ